MELAAKFESAKSLVSGLLIRCRRPEDMKEQYFQGGLTGNQLQEEARTRKELDEAKKTITTTEPQKNCPRSAKTESWRFSGAATIGGIVTHDAIHASLTQESAIVKDLCPWRSRNTSACSPQCRPVSGSFLQT